MILIATHTLSCKKRNDVIHWSFSILNFIYPGSRFLRLTVSNRLPHRECLTFLDGRNRLTYIESDLPKRDNFYFYLMLAI